MFTDTLIEDRDLYRFLIETTAQAYGIDRPDSLLAKCNEIPDIHTEADVEDRKALLPEIAAEAMTLIPGLIWIADGRTPWDVFHDVRFLGNSRLAQCSHKLKQDVADRYIKENYVPDECVLYLGIDWTEDHRQAAPTANWSPYRVKFPMCEEPYVDKADMLAELDWIGVTRPRLYSMGFAHNNCGGFCVRAGQGHFTRLLGTMPEQYAYHESRERGIREYLGKDVSIMKRVRSGQTERLTMEQLRETYEAGRQAEIDRLDIGGCGCFVAAA